MQRPRLHAGLHQYASYACASTTIIIMGPCFERREEKGGVSDILCNAFARIIETTRKLVLFRRFKSEKRDLFVLLAYPSVKLIRN